MRTDCTSPLFIERWPRWSYRHQRIELLLLQLLRLIARQRCLTYVALISSIIDGQAALTSPRSTSCCWCRFLLLGCWIVCSAHLAFVSSDGVKKSTRGTGPISSSNTVFPPLPLLLQLQLTPQSNDLLQLLPVLLFLLPSAGNFIQLVLSNTLLMVASY